MTLLQECNPVPLGAWTFMEGFNIYVDLTTACQGNCLFCIAPSTGRHDGPRYIEGCQAALDLATQLNATLQITGGEPTLSPRLVALLRLLEQYPLRRVVLNTNGYDLSSHMVKQLASAHVTHVNISRHHHESRINHAIMGTSLLPSESSLRRSSHDLAAYGISTRLQCNLLPGAIDGVPQMLEYLSWGKEIGIHEVSFSQVFPLHYFPFIIEKSPKSTAVLQLDFQSLVSMIHAHPDITFLPYYRIQGSSAWSSRWAGGGPGGVKRLFWRYQETRFSLKMLNGYNSSHLPQPTAYSRQDDPELQPGKAAFAVVHPDGRITASWDRHERLLSDPRPQTQLTDRTCNAFQERRSR